MPSTLRYTLLLVLATLEVLSQTYLAGYGNKDLAAISYLVCGLAIGLLPLLKSKEEAVVTPLENGGNNKWRIAVFTLLGLGVFYFAKQAIQAQPLDFKFADMLPIIQIMGERWLSGGEVYAIIPEIWEGMQPIYLPAMWLPYVPAVWAEVDIRWVNVCFILLGSGLAIRFWRAAPQGGLWAYGVYLPLLVLLSYILIDYTTFLTITEEPIVLGFYALLAYAVLRQHSVLLVVALVGCLLSRYALVFWVACYFGYLLWQGNRRRTLYLIAGTGLLSLLVLYLSQGIYQLELFYGLKDAYLDSFQHPDLAWRTQNTVHKNIGLARFVPFEQLLLLHRAVFWGSLVLPPALYAWYHLKLRTHVSFPIFAVCSLKLCLVYFFNMNALPYSYLFYTSTFLSLVILGNIKGIKDY